MESDDIEINLEDHKDCCRLCLTPFVESDVFYKIGEIITQRFGILTSIELQKDDELSSMICVSCNRSLGKFITFREDLIRKQQKLYNFVFGKDEVANFEEIQTDDIELNFPPSPEYMLDEGSSNIVIESGCEEECTETNTLDNILEGEDCSDKGEYYIPLESETQSNYAFNCSPSEKKVKRPKAWNWTTEMELDLIRYRNKWKNETTSDNSVYEKISKKFVIKGYPRIIGKSLKYKYEKLLKETAKFKELQSQALANPVESDDDLDAFTERKPCKGVRIKKHFYAWNQEKEVTLLYHISKIKKKQPAISSNQMYPIVLREMKLEGFDKLTRFMVQYHLKKMMQDKTRYERLMKLARDLHSRREREEKSSSTTWTDKADSALLCYKDHLECESPDLQPSDVWNAIKDELHIDGYGPFTVLDVKNRFKRLMRRRIGDEIAEDSEQRAESSEESRDEYSRSDVKRRYLYWTDEMKKALFKHRNELKKRTPPREFWHAVAEKMRIDGYGSFKPQNLMYKYFNLKKQGMTENSSLQGFDVDED